MKPRTSTTARTASPEMSGSCDNLKPQRCMEETNPFAQEPDQMKKDELLKLLNNVNEEGNTTSTFTKHSKVLLIDGLNLCIGVKLRETSIL